MKNTPEQEPFERFEGDPVDPEETERQRKADEAERAFETKAGSYAEQATEARPAVDVQLVEDVKASLARAQHHDSADTASAEAEAARTVVLEVPKKATKLRVRPSWINALFLKPSKKLVRETWGFLKRGRKLFGMTAILGASQLGASGAPKSTVSPEDSLTVRDSIETKLAYDARLTPQIKESWNEFLDFVKEKGYEGSTKLDHDQSIGEQLMQEYLAANPTSPLTYETVGLIQAEMQRVKERAQDFDARHGDANAAQTMAGVSKVDGWFGSRTSQFRFPRVTVQYPGGEKKDFGLVAGDLTADQTRALQQRLPKGVTIEKLADGYFYEDPNAPGDMIRIPPGWIK